MTLEYSLTRAEVVRAFLRSAIECPKYRNTVLLSAVAIGVCVFAVRAALLRSLTPRDAIIAVASAGAYLVLLPVWLFIRAKTAKRTLTIDPEGIWAEIGRLKRQVPWQSVNLVRDANEYVLIARVSGNAFFIPNRAFSGAEQRRQFLAEIDSYFRPGD